MKKTSALFLSCLFIISCFSACSPSKSAPSSANIASHMPASSIVANPTEEKDAAFSWAIPPSLPYDTMSPIQDYTVSEESRQFINVKKNGLWGLAKFENGEAFTPIDMEQPVKICQLGHASYNTNTNFTKQEEEEFMEKYFPFPQEIGHGSDGMRIYLKNPDSEQTTLYHMEYGNLFPIEDFSFVYKYNPEFIYGYAVGLPLESNELNRFINTAQFGVYSRTKGALTDCVFDWVYPPLNRFCIAVKKDSLYYIDIETGNIIYEGKIPPNSGEVLKWKFSPYPQFSEGYCSVYDISTNSYGFINTDGNYVIPPQFEETTHVYSGKAWVKQDGLWGQIEINK